MLAGHKMVQDANLQTLSSTLGCVLKNASSDLTKTLAISTLTHPRMLMGRQQTILYLRSRAPDFTTNWTKRFTRLAEIEAELAPFFTRDGKEKDSLEDDAIAQLSFQHEALKPLNHIPWLLFAVSLFKIWLVPAMSICLPILMWILPYILLRFVYALPITQDQYMQIIQHMFTGNLGIPPMDPPVREPLTLKSAFQYAMFAFTFAQSMIQPIQNAMHLYKTDAICTKLGQQILEIRTLLQEFRADLGELNGIHVKLSFSLEQFDPKDIRMAFISIQETPENIHMVFRDLAHLETMWRMAKSPLLFPVVFSKEQFVLTGCSDISLNLEHAVRSSIDMGAAPHAILTGPNGGGKSSFLRAVLQSVLLGHAFGFAPAKEAYMPRFVWIASGLQLRDTPGKFSMFETEVKFAADTLQASGMDGPGLVLFDELFHSTNPPDSERSAIQFLHRLWKKTQTFSIVSTHLFPLVTAAPPTVQAICCDAKQMDGGEIEFSYGVQQGVCKVSSVHKVWEKFGLARHAARSNPEQQSLSATQK